MPTRRDVALAVTEVLAPAHLAAAVGLGVSLRAGAGVVPGLLWAALVVLFTAVLPYAFILLGVRAGWWRDRHVPELARRPAALSFGVASVLAGLSLLVRLGAPREILALVVAQVVGLAVAALISVVWKVSIHVAVACGSVAVVLLVFGSAWAWTAVPALAVAWSRLELRAHTVPQVVGGAGLGTAVAAGVFTLVA
ncbi:MAG TPA: hypothetical protein VF661_04050 [Actinomycetales bacterium]